MKRIVHCGEAEYPLSLYHLNAPPHTLTLSGPSIQPQMRFLTVTGGSRGGLVARRAAYEVGKQATLSQTVVVLSNRDGLDRQALYGSWEARGPVLVLFDRPLPQRRWTLPSATLVSPFTKERADMEIGRDELCASLGEATLVVQARYECASMRVANVALELGREVFVHAVGAGNEALCSGSRALVAMGAIVVQDYGEVAQHLGWTSEAMI